jgi:RHH-type proline utilization regulon transcriptional repressor/proline dehydrogenase/delta 1-pyrroline-5-carboxylate dehydrogenase
VAARGEWDRLGGTRRAEILNRAADLFERDAATLIGLCVREAGKTVSNGIADVREAVDFLRYYANLAREEFSVAKVLPGPTGERNELSLHGRGVFACISPWNFPVAIFTGQVAGALAAGNAVVAKPAEQTPLAAYVATRLLHEAGVPGDVLHFVPGDGPSIGGALVRDAQVAGVAFTGGTDTARRINRMLADRDGAIPPFIAETGGLNAMIADSTALPEQLVRDAVMSAFDSAGQRCSALRVLFLQADIADKVLKLLEGAVAELKVGDPMKLDTDIGPVIDAEALAMLQAHAARMKVEGRLIVEASLDAAETAAGHFFAPRAYEIDGIARLEREVFGPILHVVRYQASHLPQVCEAINRTGYGLTLGVHTRIQETADFVRARARVGNLYVNRNQIGAVVGVQPFGGEGLSGTGPKAGGPHYLHRFAVERTACTNTTAAGGNASLLSLGDAGA